MFKRELPFDFCSAECPSVTVSAGVGVFIGSKREGWFRQAHHQQGEEQARV